MTDLPSDLHSSRWEELRATEEGLKAYIELQVGHKILWGDLDEKIIMEIFEEEYLDVLEAGEKAMASDAMDLRRAVGA